MNAIAKGARNERRAQRELEALGYKVVRPKRSRFGETDFFGVFDIIAMKPGKEVLCIQVKSNQRSKMKWYAKEMKGLIPYPHVNVEYWIWVDRKGWRKFMLNCHDWSWVEYEELE